MLKNTIYALSTPFVKSAIAIIRVSGSSALESLKIITKKKHFIPKKTHVSNIYDSNGDLLDNALILYFEKGKSYTGEILVEYHIHGSISVIKDLLQTLSKIENHRMAEAGEFTRRALENGKLDLIKAEGIFDLIESQTSIQRKQAIRELQGSVGSKYIVWHEKLKEILALYDATIDFSDEDIPENTFIIAKNWLTNLISDMEKEIIIGKKVKKLKQGISVAILGIPNVGKSSLINYLTAEDVAIVSDIAGTTRDVVEIFLDIAGFPVSLADTAGIRDSEDIIEQEGVRRAIKKAENCDIKIIMIDATSFEESYNNIKDFLDENTFLLINKIDMIPDVKKIEGSYLISVKENRGLKEFEAALVEKLSEITAVYENPIVLQERHNEILLDCLSELSLSLENDNDVIIISFHLRKALNHIGRIFGKTDIEEILGLIFGKFCIGK